jgi:hypothetical protein
VTSYGDLCSVLRCAVQDMVLFFRGGKFNKVGISIGLADDVVIGYIIS